MQKLELANVVVSRRLQEAGALGADYVAAEQRNEMIVREALRQFAAARGDAQAAAEEAPRSLGRFLDRLPTAQEAVDYHLSTSAPPCCVLRAALSLGPSAADSRHLILWVLGCL